MIELTALIRENKLIDQEMLDEVLKFRKSKTINHKDLFTAINNVISEHFNIEVDKIKSVCRKKEIVRPRFYAMFLANEAYGEKKPSLKTIANEYGKHHSSVVHACKTIRNMTDVYPREKRTLSELRGKVEQELKTSLSN